MLKNILSLICLGGLIAISIPARAQETTQELSGNNADSAPSAAAKPTTLVVKYLKCTVPDLGTIKCEEVTTPPPCDGGHLKCTVEYKLDAKNKLLPSLKRCSVFKCEIEADRDPGF